jgi:hypothetical protein
MPMKPVSPEKMAPMAKPLTFHVGAGTLLDGGRDLLHPVVTLGKPQDPLSRNQAVGHGGHGTGQGKHYCVLFHSFLSFCWYLV